jgi:cytoskeletal protein RodZ
LFLVTGALILLVVYFMAQSLPGTMTTSTTSPVSTAKVASAPTPHAANTPTTTKTPAATATTTYPGQQYIDSAQMATAIDPATAQPAQTSKTFAVNQRIYVAFAVHSGGAAGAACLVWYLHNAPIINYTMSVGATTHAYSYAAIGSTGPAYVEIYWASTTACTDKVLAQHVDFTVGA